MYILKRYRVIKGASRLRNKLFNFLICKMNANFLLSSNFPVRMIIFSILNTHTLNLYRKLYFINFQIIAVKKYFNLSFILVTQNPLYVVQNKSTLSNLTKTQTWQTLIYADFKIEF